MHVIERFKILVYPLQREAVVDLSVPWWDLVGFTVLRRKERPEANLFAFMIVLEDEAGLYIDILDIVDNTRYLDLAVCGGRLVHHLGPGLAV